jgi:hypothetical protein
MEIILDGVPDNSPQLLLLLDSIFSSTRMRLTPGGELGIILWNIFEKSIASAFEVDVYGLRVSYRSFESVRIVADHIRYAQRIKESLFFLPWFSRNALTVSLFAAPGPPLNSHIESVFTES